MKKQIKMRYLHMGCGESLTANKENIGNKLDHKSATSEKPAINKKNRRSKGNEGGR